MRGDFLLDTNIVIGLFAGEESVRRRVAEAPGIVLSSITVGELYYGARKSHHVDENLRRIDELIAGIVVLACDLDTAVEYGLIKHELQTKGRPLPENDVWTAAIARQYDLRLISRDKHFAEIERLNWESW